MLLKPGPDDLETKIFHRLVSEKNLVEMGVHRVMFGYRVRAGFVNSPCCELDWCGGDNWQNVERLYSICKAILSQRLEDRHCFAALPEHSMVKPFYRDLDFTTTILQFAGDFEVESLEYRFSFEG